MCQCVAWGSGHTTNGAIITGCVASVLSCTPLVSACFHFVDLLTCCGFLYTLEYHTIHPRTVVQKLKKWVCTVRDRPGAKSEIIIVTLNVKVNPEENTSAAIDFMSSHFTLLHVQGSPHAFSDREITLKSD